MESKTHTIAFPFVCPGFVHFASLSWRNYEILGSKYLIKHYLSVIYTTRSGGILRHTRKNIHIQKRTARFQLISLQDKFYLNSDSSDNTYSFFWFSIPASLFPPLQLHSPAFLSCHFSVYFTLWSTTFQLYYIFKSYHALYTWTPYNRTMSNARYVLSFWNVAAEWQQYQKTFPMIIPGSLSTQPFSTCTHQRFHYCVHSSMQ